MASRLNQLHPQVGMLALLRNRRGIISAVQPFDGAGSDGRLHLVNVEYTDAEGAPDEELIWELEPGTRLIPPVSLPDVLSRAPITPDELDALVRATRWSALTPYVDPDGAGILEKLPLASPFHGAIQVEDYQLVPLLTALRMPRVALLLADDVGLGKTIEAGLVLTELLLRRRIRRVLVICPASLRPQWRQEMLDKFALHLDEVDREQTQDLRRRLGLDANPWRTSSKIVTSYHYLKQPDVLEQFMAASRPQPGSPHLPWDLLLVDECHNLTPSPFGEDSDLARMLGVIAPMFEHKLFLTATPHNGHTRSFTGLLERLDPVRFTRDSELSPSARDRISKVVIRRLKREINERTNPPRFCSREVRALPLSLHKHEIALAEAFQQFRKRIRSVIATRARTEEVAGTFAVEILGKRLLSCPVAFADSWFRYLEGAAEPDAANAPDVSAAGRAADEDTGDDRENESRRNFAAKTVGSWLKPYADTLRAEVDVITTTLERLGFSREHRAVETDPKADARLAALLSWIVERLIEFKTPWVPRADVSAAISALAEALKVGSAKWRDDDRLVLFTEYKTSLDYLLRRLRKLDPDGRRVRELYGGMTALDREDIKSAFNDPADPIRILLATDAASEGLNLHETARFLLHFDVPWNPARLEQRNGRLDRHGQSRDVTVFHFETSDDADLRFLGQIIRKVETIREDLGATGEVFDQAFHRRLIIGDDTERVLSDLDRSIVQTRGRAEVPRDQSTAPDAGVEHARLDALAAEIDMDAGTLQETLEVALSLHGAGRPRFEKPDARGRSRLKAPLPPAWEELCYDTLSTRRGRLSKGALPGLVFDPRHFIKQINGRPIFRPEKDTRLLHLGHPLFHRALAELARRRFPTGNDSPERWTVRRGPVPKGASAVVLFTIEELAVNELRETFHHWVRTIQLPVKKGHLDKPLPHTPARQLHVASQVFDSALAEQARDLWPGVEGELKQLLVDCTTALTRELRTALEGEGNQARADEQERFRSRQGELSTLIQSQTAQKIEREIAELENEERQIPLFDREERKREVARRRAELQEELKRRTSHLDELRVQLERERVRVLNELIPKRYAMRGDAMVFPLAVEIRFPEAAK